MEATYSTFFTQAEEQAVRPLMLYLPKTMRTWPWPGEVSPYYRTGISEESAAWLATFSESTSQYPWHHLLGKLNFGM